MNVWRLWKELRRSKSHNLPVGASQLPPVNIILHGDKTVAARYIGFGRHRLALLYSQAAPHLVDTTHPSSEVVVVCKKWNYTQGKIHIWAGGDEVHYEFVASNEILPEFLSSPGHGEDLGTKFVEGHVFVARLKSKPDCTYRGESDEVLVDNAVFATQGYAFSNQRRPGASHYFGKRQLTVSNHSTLRYVRQLACRMYQFNSATIQNTSGRDYGFNFPAIFYATNGFVHEDPPGITGNFMPETQSDPLGSDFSVLPTDIAASYLLSPPSLAARTLVRPKAGYKWHQVSATREVGGQRFVLYTDNLGKKLYVMPQENTFPLNPDVVHEFDIPFPAWAEEAPAGLWQHDSGIQWCFNRDGTRMTTVLHTQEAQTVKAYDSGTDSYPSLDLRVLLDGYVQNENDPFLNPGLSDIPNRPGGTFNEIFDNPGSYWQPLYKYTPGVVEYDINLEFDVTGSLIGEVVIRNELYSPTTGRFYVASDYDGITNELVTAEIEMFSADGTPFTGYRYTNPDDFPMPNEFTALDDPTGVDGHFNFEMVFHRYTTDANDVLVLGEDGTPLPDETRRFTLYDGYVQHTRIAPAHPLGYFIEICGEYQVDPDPENGIPLTINEYYRFNVCGMDLRANAYWGVGTYECSGNGFPNDVLQRWTEHAAYSDEPVRQNADSGAFGAYGGWKTTPFASGYMPTAAERGFTKVSADLPYVLLQAVSYDHFHNSATVFTEWAVHPKQNSAALATPVIFLHHDRGQFGLLELKFVPVQIDYIRTKSCRTTHYDMYIKAREKALARNPSETEPSIFIPPERDWTYYKNDGISRPGYAPNNLTIFGEAALFFDKDNMGSFGHGGIFIRGNKDLMKEDANEVLGS